ncbi:MAG TPA: ABC transporter permease, partial [Usitatibacter sp.]|nr:ABC transporter permease [Usitatibacter sp.]
MRALGAIARFELAERMRRVSTHVYFVVFAAIAALWMAAAGGAFANAKVAFSADKVFINSPFAIAQTVVILGFFGITVVAAMMGRAVQQDFEYQSFHFFFTSPITKADYYLGRYLGALAALVYVFLGITAGILLGSHWPGVEASRLGPWSALAFAQPYALILIPNIVLMGGCFFGLAALTRRMMPVYVAGIVVLMGYIGAMSLMGDVENKPVAALLDPVGSIAMSLMTRYWSVSDKNTRLVPLAGELLWNRALWLTLGLVVFAACYARFKLAYSAPERTRKGKAAPDVPGPEAPRSLVLPDVAKDDSTRAWLRELPSMTALYLRETVKNPYFVVIVLAGVLFVFVNGKVVGSIYGTTTYPVTYQVLDTVSGLFRLFMLIVTALYAGELVWRERDARVDQLTDSLPVPTWLVISAKLATLFVLQALLQLVVLACGIVIQLAYGYTHFELGQYLHRLFLIQLPSYWTLAALAFFIHVAINNKYVGHFLVVLYWIVSIAAALFGYDHALYRFGATPPAPYSDMNGYGHFLPAFRWFQAYWIAGSVLLIMASRLLWIRGVDWWGSRFKVARERWSRPVSATTIAAAIVMAALGGWIFYNTNILNQYRSDFAEDEIKAEYERHYKALEGNPQPRIAAVTLAVDIFPHEHRIRFHGQYKLTNKTGKPVNEVYLELPEDAEVHALTPSVAWKEVENNPELFWRRFALAQPLAAGAGMTLDFDLEYAAHGFRNSGPSRTVVDNGTFVNSAYLPHIGYQDILELVEDRDRMRHGLKPRARMPDLDDAQARLRNYISSDADWIDFDATVSTDTDQIAMAPGYLEREWTDGGRRYFHYRMDRPILGFYAFLSARYAVKKDTWHPQGENVAIEIYYQPGHEY